MTAARKRPPEGVTISWGWIGKTVAAVVVAGLPALVGLVWRGVGDIRREIAAHGRSTASERITALVKADRCACELRNPQGSCCLGNVASATRSLLAEGLGSPAERAQP